MKKIIYNHLIVLIILLLCLSALKAEKYELYRKRFVAGAMINTLNSYYGSKNYITIPTPYIDFENKYFTIRTDKGILYRVAENVNYLLSLGAFYYIPRNADMDKPDILKGLHSVKFDIPIVLNFNIYLLSGVDFGFRVEQSTNYIKSQLYKLFFSYNKAINDTFFYEGSLGLSFASKGYINNYFAITKEELLVNNYFNKSYQYNNEIGLLNFFTNHYIYYDFSYNWSLLLGFNLSAFVGSVKNSPIIQSKYKTQESYIISINYKF